MYGYILFFPSCEEKVRFHPVVHFWVCSQSMGWQCWEQGMGPGWEGLCSEKGQEEPVRLVATGKCWSV